MSQTLRSVLECPYCTCRFDDPHAVFQVNEEFECPQCGMDFRVSSLEPLEFDYSDPWATRLPYVFEISLIGKGAKLALESSDDVSAVARIARKQGARELSLRIKFDKRECPWGVAEVADIQ